MADVNKRQDAKVNGVLTTPHWTVQSSVLTTVPLPVSRSFLPVDTTSTL